MTEHIKINDTVPRVEYAADGMTTVYPAPFPFLKAADLQVWIGPTAKELGTDYTVSGAGMTAGGTVTFVAAPANSATVVIHRHATIARTSDFLPGGSLRADTLNDELDRLTLSLQDADAARNRSLRVADHDVDAVPGPLPNRAARASRVLAFDDAGDPVASPETSTISDIGNAVTEAIQGATSAAASALAASNDAASVADIAALVQNIPNIATSTGNGATDTLTLPATPVDGKALLVSLDGIFQHTSAFSVAGTTLTFAAAPPTGVAIEVRDLSATAIVNAGEVSTVASISADVSTVANIHTEVTTVAANDSDISDVADDLNGANTIGAAVTSASNAATSASDAATSATAAATAEANAETAETGAVAAQTAAEAAQVASEAAQAAAETAQAAAVTAETNAETAKTNADASAAAAAASASGAASAVTDAIIAAARAGFRNRFGLMPPSIFGFDLGEVSQIALTRATVGFRTTDAVTVESKAIDALRLTHDPETGEPLGLLLEPAAVNYMTASNSLTGNNVINTTHTTNDAVAPDGTTTAFTVAETVDSGLHKAGATVNTASLTSGEVYLVSMFVKDIGASVTSHTVVCGGAAFSPPAVSGDYLGWTWDFATETITPYKETSTAVKVGFLKFADGWYLLWASQTAVNTGTTGVILQFTNDGTSYAGDTDNEIAGWNCKVEAVSSPYAIPSSAIETSGSTVTRSPDLATADLSAISAFRPGGFSLLVEADIHDDDGVLLSVGTGSTNEIALDLQTGDLHLTGADGLDLTAASGLSPGDRVVIALRVAADDVAISVDGATVVADSSHSMNADADEMQFGANVDGSDGLPCTIRQVAIFGPLPDATLEAMSNG